MKLYRYLLTTLFITLFAVSSVMAMEFTDNSAVNELNSESVANASTLEGPFVISSIVRTNSTTIKATFTDGNTFTSTYATRQNTLCTALANNSAVYLFVEGSSVYGVVSVSS
jgi:hypothetical protein